VLEGDQTGQELLEESLRVLAPEVTRVPTEFVRYDLSLQNRRATQNGVVHEAAKAMAAAGLGLKAATITPEGKGDVGSPNAILREEIDGKVILRTGRRIPGVRPVGGVHAPIAVVRMAVDDAYNAKEWRETKDGEEWAYRTEKISRATCRAVAEFAFQYAKKTGAKVFGGPKYTVSPVYEGMFKEELDAAHQRHTGRPDAPFVSLRVSSWIHPSALHTSSLDFTRRMTSSVNSVVVACAPRSAVLTPSKIASNTAS